MRSVVGCHRCVVRWISVNGDGNVGAEVRVQEGEVIGRTSINNDHRGGWDGDDWPIGGW
jgi:hypothetical protein